jgi:hypothetical protein
MKVQPHDNIIEEIDSIIRANAWFDFHVFTYQKKSLIIAGGVDLTYYHSLEIIFDDVYFVSAVIQGWRSNTRDAVFVELTGDPGVNSENEIEEGNRVFAFKADDYRQKMLIAARTVRYNTNTVYYYPRTDPSKND